MYNTPLLLGRNAIFIVGFPFANAYEGLLDDLRIYDRALTESEILELATPVPPDPVELLLSLSTDVMLLNLQHGIERPPLAVAL